MPRAGSYPYRCAVLDRDGKFGDEATDFVPAGGLNPTRLSLASPWQNRAAARCIRRCSRDLRDQLIVLNEVHLRLRIREYVSDCHADRIQDSL